MIFRLADRSLRTTFGEWKEIQYHDGQRSSLALVYGDIREGENIFCRVHSSCISAHVFNSTECDCRQQMAMAQALIQDEGRGLVIWLDQEGRGNGHVALMMAAQLSNDHGIPQTEAYRRLGYPDDSRGYREAAWILTELKVTSIRLLSNSPDKAQALAALGIVVTGTQSVALDLRDYPQLRAYYADKLARGHMIGLKPESENAIRADSSHSEARRGQARASGLHSELSGAGESGLGLGRHCSRE